MAIPDRGLKWEAVPVCFRRGTFISQNYSGDDLCGHIVMVCFDTRGARATTRGAVRKSSMVLYAVGAGNNADGGQSIVGSLSTKAIEGQRCDCGRRPSSIVRLWIRPSTITEIQAVVRLRPLSDNRSSLTLHLLNAHSLYWPDCFAKVELAFTAASLTWQ